MSWFSVHRRSALIVGFTLLLPAALYLKTLFGFIGLGVQYAQAADNLRPRIARMQGLMDSEQALRASAAQVGDRLAALGFSAAEDATEIAASLQADVRQLFAESGFEVSNSQVLPTRRDDTFDLVGLKLTASGELAALDATLMGIAAFRPMLLVETLDVFPAAQRQRKGAVAESRQVTAVIQLFALRMLP